MPGALDGIRVIDFGQYIAGPLAGMLLADQGADVIRVDPPGGPLLDVPANATWNRGKRSIALDLRDPADAATAFQLAAGADVVLENFRPGVLAGYGLGADVLCAANPRLVHLSMPGFAASDPRRDVPAWEGVVSAAASLYSRPGDPVFTAIPIASSYAAFLGVDAVVMALIARERDGVGQQIEVPLYDASFAAIGYRAQRRHDAEPAASLSPGTGPTAPWFGPHLCSDGRWAYFHIGNKNTKDFIDAAGAAQWWDAPDAPARIEELFASRTAQEWEDLGASVGTEMAVCTTSEEWLHHPHAIASSMVIDVPDPRYGLMRQPGIAVRLSATPGAVRGPAPALDCDRAPILAEATATRAVRATPAPPHHAGGSALSAEAPPEAPLDGLGALEGLRVLDLCIVLAGPTCGRTLAEYGADVIKIDGPDRASSVGSGGTSDILTAFNIEVNRGKRSIVLDLRTEDGQARFWELVEDADVIVENYRHGIVERLGIGYEQVRQRRPDIIYASLNAYGYEGPWADRPGHEQLGQSVTGMSLRFGGDQPPVLQSVAVNDFGTGFLGAYAVGLAVLHRQRTGEGQWVNGALAYTACTLQSLYMHEYEGKRWDEPRGQDAPGWGPLQRIYAASDASFFLGARDDQRPAVAGVAGVDHASDGPLADALAGAFAQQPAQHWIDRLRAAGVGAHELCSVRQIMDDPWARARGLSITRDHPGLGLVDTVGAVPQLSRTPLRPGRPAPMRGADAEEILQQLRERTAAHAGTHRR